MPCLLRAVTLVKERKGHSGSVEHKLLCVSPGIGVEG